MEGWYFAQVFYAILGPAFGISISGLGFLGLASLAGLCVIRNVGVALSVAQLVLLPLSCGASLVLVQTLAHGQSFLDDSNREFIVWMMGLFVAQSLALRRGFLHRLGFVVLAIGLLTLPYLQFRGTGTRTGLDNSITIANPNDLGAWFGFCLVYFTILGVQTRRLWLRIGSWTVALGCAAVVGLTVSRGSLLAAASALLFSMRRFLKRGFFPLILLVAVGWSGYAFGFFDKAISLYEERALVETGRLLVWPLALQRIADAPLTGFGTSHVGTYVPSVDMVITPHNGFLYIALVGGLVPLVLFCAYWIRLGVTAVRSDVRTHEDAPFHVGLLIYCVLSTSDSNGSFTMPYMVGALATITAAGFFATARQRDRRQLFRSTSPADPVPRPLRSLG
jgi:hypothetical protein